MDKYRKKPLIVEAVLVTPARLYEIAAWCGGTPVKGVNGDWKTVNGISIPTLEGVQLAAVGCWVIRGTQGEFYGCQPDIFHETYEPVNSVRWDTDQPGQPGPTGPQAATGGAVVAAHGLSGAVPPVPPGRPANPSDEHVGPGQTLIVKEAPE